MFTPFDKIADNSRIWIYQAHRELNDAEAAAIKKQAIHFIEGWTAHNQTLQASFEIFHNIFLVIAVDQNHNDASGCSIDKSVYFIRQLEKEFNLSLLDRFNIAFRKNSKVQVESLNNFVKSYKEDKINDDLPVFNNIIMTKKDLQTKWEIPLRESWVMTKL